MPYQAIAGITIHTLSELSQTMHAQYIQYSLFIKEWTEAQFVCIIFDAKWQICYFHVTSESIVGDNKKTTFPGLGPLLDLA